MHHLTLLLLSPLFASATAFAAPAGKMDVCHSPGGGASQLIRISVNW